MSEAEKSLTAEEEAAWRRAVADSGSIHLNNVVLRQCFIALDAERAKVEALRDEKAAVEWMLEQDRAALAAAVTRATAAEAEADKVRDLIDFWFSPWGAYKTEKWEEISGDRPFTSETMLEIIRAALAKEKPDAAE